jgi:Lar family restriction alleviation protein
MDKLLPCPFCAYEVKVIVKEKYKRKHYAYCSDCQCSGPTAETGEEAVKSWNTRTSKVGAWECRKMGEEI